MIVRPVARALYLITQPDHAALARRVMEQWTPLLDEPRRASILLAIGEHDNGWQEPDQAPLIDPDSGRISDFVRLPAPLRQAVWPRGVERLRSRDRWAAALVAEHAITVYARYRSEAAWTDFFRDMERRRTDLLAATGRQASELLNDYRYVRIGDLISLLFCTANAEFDGFDGWSFRLHGDRVATTPDPFAGIDVPLSVPVVAVPNRQFDDTDDLRRAIAAGERLTLTGIARGSSEPRTFEP